MIDMERTDMQRIQGVRYLKKYWKSFGLYAVIFVVIAMLIAVAGQKADRSSTVI